MVVEMVNLADVEQQKLVTTTSTLNDGNARNNNTSTQHYSFKKKLLLAGILLHTIVSTVYVFNRQQKASLPSSHPSDEPNIDIADTAIGHCEWSPLNYDRCTSLLKNRIPALADEDTGSDFKFKRFLFFGDSTIAHIFDESVPITDNLINNATKGRGCWSLPSRLDPKTTIESERILQCEYREAPRCNFNHIFNADYATEWKKPESDKFEGPTANGLSHPFCQDCKGCNSRFTHCEINEGDSQKDHEMNDTNSCQEMTTEFVYGGYIGIEFARDVELQSQKYGTTQEIVASYLSESWNDPAFLMAGWSKPICLIAAGNHDLTVSRVNTSDIVTNVYWYLSLMIPICDHIIWLSNTAPTIDTHYPQTRETIKSLNDAVYDFLVSTPEWKEQITFIDVYNASLSWPHKDYIHMDSHWYRDFGNWFTNLTI